MKRKEEKINSIINKKQIKGGNMLREIKLSKIIVFVLMLTMIATIFVSDTYSRFTTTASGSDTVVVAKWSFEVNGEEIAVTGDAKTIEFGLFDTIYDSDGENEETDVAEGYIAPGTSGNFEFVLQNTSEVKTQYGVEFEVTNENDIPIEYSLDGIEWSNELNNIDYSNKTVLDIGSNTKTIKVYWRWAFEGETDSDTLIGSTAGEATEESEIPNITVKATINAVQVENLEIDELAEKYTLSYYANIQDAIESANNETYGENQTATKYEANAAVYVDENSKLNAILLEDTTLTNEITTSKDMTLNLNGKTLESTDTVAIAVNSGNLTIDGQTEGSKIVTSNTGLTTSTVQVNAGSCTINGGTYETNSTGVGTDANPNSNITVASSATLTMNNAKVSTNDSVGAGIAGVNIASGGEATISNSTIESKSNNALWINGIINDGTMTITNSTIKGLADYKANAAGNNYGSGSMGISNNGTMTLKNCNVYGTHSGIRSTGTLYIDGGTYEAYGHGGIYFGGAGTTSYVKNATVRYCEMADGYIADSVAGTNQAGFYIGGANNVTVYMDNCELYGPYYPAVLRSGGGESNNTLYLSNTNATGYSKYFRNDASNSKGNRIYIGLGNNFDIEATASEENTVETEDDYSTVFPEY